MTTPAGWYPDPGHAGPGPAPERWWDGTAWTGDTRPAPASHGQPFGPPPTPPPPRSRRGPVVASLAGAAALLIAVVAGAVLLADDDASEESGAYRPGAGEETGRGQDDGSGEENGGGGDDEEPSPREERTGPEEDGGQGEGQEPRNPSPDGYSRAQAGGVALPLLQGWQEGETEAGISLVSDGEYPCPADASMNCVDAGVFASTVPRLAASSPEGAARADLPGHELAAYGPAAYGPIENSEEVLAEEITVAGQEGFRVRNRVTTEAGFEAFVETVAFPAPNDPQALVLLRLGFDIGEDAPPPEDMTTIVLGAREVSGRPGTEA